MKLRLQQLWVIVDRPGYSCLPVRSAFYNAFKKGNQKKLLSKPDLVSFAKMKHFDTIGDVHGQAGKLRDATLLKMVLVTAPLARL